MKVRTKEIGGLAKGVRGGVSKWNGRSDSELFKTYVRSCMAVYDYNEETIHIAEKENQMKSVFKLKSLVSNTRMFGTVVAPNMSGLFEMLKARIFRPPSYRRK